MCAICLMLAYFSFLKFEDILFWVTDSSATDEWLMSHQPQAKPLVCMHIDSQDTGKIQSTA